MDRLISIEETCKILGVGRTKVYELIAQHKLETRHIGRRHLVMLTSIQEFVRGEA